MLQKSNDEKTQSFENQGFATLSFQCRASFSAILRLFVYLDFPDKISLKLSKYTSES